MEFLAKVQRYGLVTVPQKIRNVYDIKEGDMVKLEFIEKVKMVE